MKAWALTIKTHGSHRALAAVQRLQPFLRQLWCPRLWLRKSHTLSALVRCLLYCCCIEISFLPSFQKPLLGCNIIIDPQDLFPASHFRVHNFSTLMTVLGILKAPLIFFPILPTFQELSWPFLILPFLADSRSALCHWEQKR